MIRLGLRENKTDFRPGENIAGATRGHSGIAGEIDVRGMFRRGDDGSRAFEHNDSFRFFDGFARGGGCTVRSGSRVPC